MRRLKASAVKAPRSGVSRSFTIAAGLGESKASRIGRTFKNTKRKERERERERARKTKMDETDSCPNRCRPGTHWLFTRPSTSGFCWLPLRSKLPRRSTAELHLSWRTAWAMRSMMEQLGGLRNAGHVAAL